MSELRLDIEALRVSLRGRELLHGIDLADLRGGQLLALVGPNGAGKSTLLRALAGLLPASGSARLDGLDLLACSRAERARQLGFMPQALPQDVALTVLETLLGVWRLDGAAQKGLARARAVLERLGIQALAMQPLERLSGGQRQMVSLAQTVIRDPRLMLLDEPTSALDLRHQYDVMSTLRGLVDEGRIAVVVLHDLALAARWADRVAVLDGGRLRAFGSPVQTLDSALLEQVYRVRGRVEHCSQGHLQIAIDGAAP